MSLKYRFIYTFVLLELFFISLIITTNFYTIKNMSDKLITEKIESNTTLLLELIKVPISIFDLATLDNLLENSSKYVNSIIILDNQNRIISSKYNLKNITMEELIRIKKNNEIKYTNDNYSIRFKKIYDEDRHLGSIYIVFDLANIKQVIDSNKQYTFMIVFLEILLSTLFAYFIGNNLTKKLIDLSNSAIKIGKDKDINIPHQDEKNEIGILSNAMYSMQCDLIHRSNIIKHSNEVLKGQKEELIIANKIKDDFLANMSHELKTPLNSINVISSIMKKNSQDNLTQKQVKNLQIINQCGKDLLFLVNDVLDISKLEAGEIILNYEEVNLKTFIDKIYNTFLPQMENKGLNFIVNYNSDIDFIETDEMRLNQIIYNLLSNALKFTNKGTVTIDVTNTLSKLIIIVEDTGVGIPENKINHIFDRFKQVDTSINRKYSGTGLGLAISRELAYLLKGDIFLESKINKYTKIELHIPINSNDKIEILGNNYKLKKDKNSILVLNNEPLFFFKIIVELAKKYEIEQVNNLTDFLKNNTNKKFEKAIMYTKEYTEELNQKLSNTHNLNYVVIYEKCDKDLPDLINSTYEKNEFLENINNIKDFL